MYGPRSAYDSATLERWDEWNRKAEFARQVIEALKDPKVRAELRKVLERAEAEAGNA